MTARGEILLLHDAMDVIAPMIEPEFKVVRLWDYPDLDALVADKKQELRAIVTHGGQVIGHEIVEAFPNLGLIASIGAGFEGVNVRHARARGIAVTHGAGVNADDVADAALGLMLASACDIFSGQNYVLEGRWTETDRGPQRLSLAQRHVGIFGLGSIGKAIVERVEAFKCAISWYGPNPKPEARWPRLESLEALAEAVDILVVAAPLNEETRHVVGRDVIERLGPGGLLVNIARGGLVDEDALIAALKDGRLGAAALDVQAQEPTPPQRWADVPNVILTPHIGGYATGGMLNIGDLLRRNLRRFFAGEPVLNPVPEA